MKIYCDKCDREIRVSPFSFVRNFSCEHCIINTNISSNKYVRLPWMGKAMALGAYFVLRAFRDDIWNMYSRYISSSFVRLIFLVLFYGAIIVLLNYCYLLLIIHIQNKARKRIKQDAPDE